MPSDLRDALRRAAAVPDGPLDLDRLVTRGHRRRRHRTGSAAGAFVLVVAVTAGVVMATRPASDPPPAAAPIRLDALPAGWTELATPPVMRYGAATAWTGDQLFVWGGARSDLRGPEPGGYVLDTRIGAWREMAPSPLAARSSPATAWTGTELLVWGGGDETARLEHGDGAAYDPQGDTWRRLPAAPLSARAPLSVWTGEELIVWGTSARGNPVPTDGAAYRPATDSWRKIPQGPVELTDATAVWTGAEMVVLGAVLDGDNRPRTPTAIAAAYDPAADRWRRLPDPDLSPQASTAAWNGEELIAWDYRLEARAYDPARDRWRPLPDVPLDDSECAPESVPVGGDVFGAYCGDLVLYDSGEERWRTVSRVETGGWFTLVGADPVVVLLAEVEGPTALAYRPPAGR
jgi:hypothetical protein